LSPWSGGVTAHVQYPSYRAVLRTYNSSTFIITAQHLPSFCAYPINHQTEVHISSCPLPSPRKYTSHPVPSHHRGSSPPIVIPDGVHRPLTARPIPIPTSTFTYLRPRPRERALDTLPSRPQVRGRLRRRLSGSQGPLHLPTPRVPFLPSLSSPFLSSSFLSPYFSFRATVREKENVSFGCWVG